MKTITGIFYTIDALLVLVIVICSILKIAKIVWMYLVNGFLTLNNFFKRIRSEKKYIVSKQTLPKNRSNKINCKMNT